MTCVSYGRSRCLAPVRQMSGLLSSIRQSVKMRARQKLLEGGSTSQLGIPDKYPGDENQRAAQGHLHGGRERRRVHETVTHPRDGGELDDDYEDRHPRGVIKVVHKIRQRVTDAAQSRHGSGYEPANPWSAASRQATVVRQRLGKTHADTGSDGCGE